jgi:hypothetical protein
MATVPIQNLTAKVMFSSIDPQLEVLVNDTAADCRGELKQVSSGAEIGETSADVCYVYFEGE